MVEIRHVKRLMGVSNPSKETLKYMSDLVGCPVRRRTKRNDITTSDVELCPTSKHCVVPEEVSAATLAKMKGFVEKKFNEEVTHAVVTVPAYFDHAQRSATRVVFFFLWIFPSNFFFHITHTTHRQQRWLDFKMSSF